MFVNDRSHLSLQMLNWIVFAFGFTFHSICARDKSEKIEKEQERLFLRSQFSHVCGGIFPLGGGRKETQAHKTSLRLVDKALQVFCFAISFL